MSRLDKMVQEMCPDGVEYRPLWSVTTWDKRFNGVPKSEQPNIIKYPYLLAQDLFNLECEGGDVYLLSTGEKTGWTNEMLAKDYMCEGEVITIPWGKSRPVAEVIKYYKGKFVTADNRIVTSSDTTILLNRFLYYWMQSQGEQIDSLYRGSGIRHPSMKDLLHLSLPIPPLAIQKEIVRILDTFTELEVELEAELEARKKQYDWYRHRLLYSPKTEIKYLSQLADNLDAKRLPITAQMRQNGNIPYYGASGIVDYVDNYLFDEDLLLVSEDGANLKSRVTPIAFSITGPSWVNNHAHVLRFKDQVIRQYVEFFLNSIDLSSFISSGAQPKLNQRNLNRIPIHIPVDGKSLNRIVQILNSFKALTTGLTSGLPAEITARRKQYEYYRDKLLDFPRKNA